MKPMAKKSSPATTISRLLIANRGEIVCRIIRTCKRLGIETVAIHSKGEESSPHALQADYAYLLSDKLGTAAYLDGERVLAIAKECGAQAIHPGYGFLAENPDFAEAVQEAGLIFVGPTAAAMRKLGHKHSARTVAIQAGVPVAPGYDEEKNDEESLTKAASKLGFPLLIKASAGGGGKGMRRVSSAAEFPSALAGAKREALSFFGDGRLLLEKIISPARHIEVQLLADNHGNVLHLFERDCSLQRRHQKVIEESPAPLLTSSMRTKICNAAVTLAKAVGLTGAATAEFLVPLEKNENEDFFFLEVNPRLQVEHPVTEFVTGLDLVELQLSVAAGNKLALTQEQLSIKGHAVQARIYAEVPRLGFTPNTGKVSGFFPPEGLDSPALRFDHALQNDFEVTTNFDPMLGKLIAYGESRDEALSRLRQLVSGLGINGVWTNQGFVLRVLATKEVIQGPVSTTFLDEREELRVLPASAGVISRALIAHIVTKAFVEGERSINRLDPFSTFDYFRGPGSVDLNTRPVCEPEISYQINSGDFAEPLVIKGRVTAAAGAVGSARPSLLALQVTVEGVTHQVGIVARSVDGIPSALEIDGHRIQPHITSISRSAFGNELKTTISLDGSAFRITQLERKAEGEAQGSGDTVTSPLPGSIIALKVKSGQKVVEGETLVVLESMKMEHALNSSRVGIVKEVHVALGAAVKEGQVLMTLELEG